MKPSEYDIAIIGGGLAGLSMAILSARKGYKVILFEKGSYPAHKVCGEYIGEESRSFLQQLGVPLPALNLPAIDRLQVSDLPGNLYAFPLRPGGFGISRYILDNLLYERATDSGARVVTRTRVDHIKYERGAFRVDFGKQSTTANVAIGAFGKRSNLDLKWNRPFITSRPGRLDNYLGVKYHIKYAHPSNLISLHNFTDGYCGISQIENELSCLCYLTKASNLVSSNNSIARMEQTVLSANPHLKSIFAKAEFIFGSPVTISQISFARKTQVEDHVLLTGDAAGMISPLCGNGMSMALHAGKMAFEAVVPFLETRVSRDEMEKVYQRSWDRQFGRRLFTGRVVQQIFGNQKATSLFLAAMNKLPFIARTVIGATHGKPF